MNLPPLATHLRVKRYGDFTLTDAVRPGPDVPVVPRPGYRVETYRDPHTRMRLPMLAAAVSAERLFETFLALLSPLGEMVHGVLESSHDADADRHLDLRRSDIDKPVLESHLCDYEDLLLNDGCAGVAVIDSRRPVEVQLDEHKLLFVYARNLTPFRRILRDFGLRRNDELALISDAEHVHHSDPRHAPQFRQLCYRLGVGDMEGVMSDEVEG